MKKIALSVTSLLLGGCLTIDQPAPYSSGGSYYPSATTRAPAPASAVDPRSALEGCTIVAEDGQVLGLITSNAYNSDSFLNEFGRYGGKYSATSIWNEYGQYGGEYSRLSPFNAYTSTPPRIIARNGSFVGYLTVNQYKTPSISPWAVAALMK